MTRDDFINTISPVVRHGLTAVGALLAARGMSGASDAVAAYSSGAVLLVGSLGWSMVEKSKLLAGMVEAAPVADVDQVLDAINALRKQGASPLLLTHFTQVLATLAQQELAAMTPVAPPQRAPAPQPYSPPPMAPEPVVSGPFMPAETHGDMA